MTKIKPYMTIYTEDQFKTLKRQIIQEYKETDGLTDSRRKSNVMVEISFEIALIALHSRFGFGKDRLKRFADEFYEDFFEFVQAVTGDMHDCIPQQITENLFSMKIDMDHAWTLVDRALKEALQEDYVERLVRTAWTENALQRMGMPLTRWLK